MGFEIGIGVAACLPLLVLGWLAGLKLGRFLTVRYSILATLGLFALVTLAWADLALGNALVGVIGAPGGTRLVALILGVFLGLPLIFGGLFGVFFAWTEGSNGEESA